MPKPSRKVLRETARSATPVVEGQGGCRVAAGRTCNPKQCVLQLDTSAPLTQADKPPSPAPAWQVVCPFVQQSTLGDTVCAQVCPTHFPQGNQQGPQPACHPFK